MPTAATPIQTESFDTVVSPHLPLNSRQWSADGTNSFTTTRQTSVDGWQSLASTGTVRTDGRYWLGSPQPADSGASVRLLPGGSPLSLIVRGSNLDTATPTYLAAVVTAGGKQLSLVEVSNGQVKFLGQVSRSGTDSGLWFTLSVQPTGNTAAVRLQRPDTRQFLTPQGRWQAEPVDAIRADTSVRPASGLVGVGRSPGATGLAYFDMLSVTVPPATATKENFDTVPIGTIPSGWQEWTSDGTAGFGASTTRSVSGSGLAAEGNSRTTARVWLGSLQPADVQASASVFADSLTPAGVVVRGSNLSSTTPTFYSLTAVRGTEVRLAATVNGVESTLSTVKSKDYVSQKWLRLTLTAVGNQLRAVVVRADTGQWLTPDGTWSSDPQPALTATDGRITGVGFVGLQRSAATAGAVSFDDVQVTPGAAITGPPVTATANQSTTGVKGDLVLTVNAPGARRVEFRVNGVLRSMAATPTATYTLDTTSYANGPLAIEVRATDDAGNIGTASLHYTLTNPNPSPPPTRPELPRKLPNIRVAQLVYEMTAVGDTEKAYLASSVDLVVSAPKHQGVVDAASPGTQQLLYTNLSNMYGGLLTDWLAYADRTGVSRELAFYHVPTATPFDGGSPSAMPVNWLWQVSRGNTDLTYHARGGRATGVLLGQAGEAVTFGYPDRFRELNFDLLKVAGGGWQGVYEYVSRVNADGSPAEWKPLALLADSTGGLAKPGRVTFDPPQGWVPARVNSGEMLYTVRLRTIVTGTPPEARSVFGRDFVGAFGTRKGVIPAFDSSADKDRDGYLSDTEYAGRRAGFDARFEYESRLFYPKYGQMRFVTNPSPTAVKRWAMDYHVRLLPTQPLSDGLFVDNANGRLPFTGIPVIEATAGYTDDSAAMTAAVWKAVAPKVVFSNTAGGFADANPITRASTGAFEEFVLRPMDATWSAVLDVQNLVKSRLAADSPAPYTILDTHPGSFATTDARVRAATLAYYYLVGDPDRTFIMFFGGLNPSAAWADTFIPAVQTDLGKPQGEMTAFASGNDPQNSALGFKVYGRQYEKGLVLYKPLSYTLGKGTGTTADATATTHQLGGNYRVLNPDNTLGPVVTNMTLRNGEGVVLMKA